MSKCTYVYKGVESNNIADIKRAIQIERQIEQLKSQGLSGAEAVNKLRWEAEINRTSYMQKTNGGFAYVNAQMDKRTPLAQKETVDKLLNQHMRVSMEDKTHTYAHESGVELNSMSETLKANAQYKFDGKNYDEDSYEVNRHWGNQLDFVLSNFIMGKSEPIVLQELEDYYRKTGEPRIISPQVISTMKMIHESLKTQFPKGVMLSQMKLHNLEKRTAGTADLIIVQPNGTAVLIDFKSSTKPFTKKYQSGIYEDWYEKDYSKAKDRIVKWGRKSRHRAQLSGYKGLAASKGVDITDMYVLPLLIVDKQGDVVTEVQFEENKLIPLNFETRVGVQFYSDAEYDAADQVPYDSITGKESIVEKILETLETMRSKAKASTERDKNIRESKALLMIEQIQSATKVAEKIDNFVNFLYKELINTGGEYNFSLFAKMENLEAKLASSTDATKIVEELYKIKDSLDTFKDSISQLTKFYTDVPIADIEAATADSTLGKIGKILEVSRILSDKIEDAVLPRVAQVLYENADFHEDAQALKDIKDLEKSLEKYKERAEKAIGYSKKALESTIKRQQEKLDKIKLQVPSYENILEQLKTGAFSDISWMDKMANPAASSSNQIIATWTKLISYALDNIRQTLRDYSFHAKKAFDKYAKGDMGLNPAQFNSPFYSEITDFRTGTTDSEGKTKFKTKYQLVDVINWEKYYGALYAIRTKPNATQEDWNNFFESNTEKLQDENYEITNPETNTKTIIRLGYKAVLEKKRKDFKNMYGEEKGKDAYDKWFRSQVTERDGKVIYKNELAQPKMSKYRSEKYDQMTKEQKEYYNFLIATYFEAQALYPDDQQNGFDLPSVEKTTTDMIMKEGLWETMKHGFNSATGIVSADRETLGSDTQDVPILFSQPMPKEEQSVDLLSSILIYKKGAMTYDARSSMVGVSSFILDSFKNNPPNKTDSLGRQILSRAASSLGRSTADKKNAGESNLLDLAQQIFDVHLYGRSKLAHRVRIPGTNRTVDIGKLSDLVVGFASKTQIAFSPILAVANSLQAQAQLAIEGVAKEFVSPKDMAFAYLKYGEYELRGDFLKDMYSTVSTSFIGQLLEMYDVQQGTHVNEYGRKITQGVGKQILEEGYNVGYRLMNKGEHHATTVLFLAMMNKTKVKDAQGNTISLLDAYEQLSPNGPVTLKPGVDISSLGLTSGQASFPVIKRLHAMNQRMHGVYDNFSKEFAQRHFAGRLAFMYRKYLIPGFKKRFKGLGYDSQLQGFTEGTYVTFYKNLFFNTGELLSVLNPFSSGDTNLTKFEQANIRRTAMEYALIGVLGIIIKAVTSMMESADDDEKKKYAAVLLFATRLQTELNQYLATMDVNDAFRMATKFTLAESVIKKLFRFIGQAQEDFPFTNLETYKRNEGIWQKGDPKLKAYFFKLLGIQGSKIDPEEALEILKLQKMF